MPRPAALAAAAVSLVVLGSALAGCQTGPQSSKRNCTPKPGMTSEQLVACGCLLHDQGGLALAPVSRSRAGADTQSVIIVNYICPLGKEGIAIVSVVNGVADRVYR
ncbi:MAG: hypothetical protein K9L70_07570 [Thiohalocapsa sp.]|nr:hypothetical protein [Thiohalocapsa sp.]MCF7988853.1 hypothetical protein [Thiohalocapsa sp.]